MVYTVEFTDKDTMLMQDVAKIKQVSVESFIIDAVRKAAQNAAYTAKLDRADEQIREGKVVFKTMEELEAMAK